MKKVLSAILCAVVLLTTFVLPTFATTKNDLVTEAAKSKLYQYVKVSVENAIRTLNITDAQAESLLPIVKSAVAITNKYSDTTVYNDTQGQVYSDADLSAMLNYVDQACAILNISYTVSPVSGTSKHTGDIIYKFYDNSGNLIVSYDGDNVLGGHGTGGGGGDDDDDDNGGNGNNNGNGGNGGNGAIKDTSSASYTSTVVEMVAATSLVVAACATFVVARKKVTND